MKTMLRLVTILCWSLLIALCPGQTFEWTQYSAGGGVFGSSATGRGIDSDTLGNRYIAGYFSQTMIFDGDTLTSMGGSNDIFVAKYDSSGAYQWAVRAGGLLQDQGMDIAVDDGGNCYVIGTYQGIAYFDTLSIASSANLADVFVAKYGPNGAFLWVTRIGGQVEDYGNGISINQSGQIFVVGDYRISAYFYEAGSAIPSDTLFSVTPQQGDVFTACYTSGGGLLWARSAGGADGETAQAVTTDKSGDAYVAGAFNGTAFFEGQSVVSEGNQDIFIAKYHSSGSLLWVRSFASTSSQNAYGISMDSSNNIYLVGTNSDILVLANDTLSWVESGGAFLAKFNADAVPLWARAPESFNFTGIQYHNVRVTPAGEASIAGSFNGSRAILGNDTLVSGPGSEEVLTARYSSDGQILWARQAGRNASSEIAYDVSIGPANRSYFTGSYTAFAVFGADTLDQGPGMFLTKMASDPLVAITEPDGLPSQFELRQNYPNPFNPETTISFSLRNQNKVAIVIYNLLGQKVRTLLEAIRAPGEYQVVWNGDTDFGRPAASGVYFYRLTLHGMSSYSGEEFTQTRKMILLR